MCSQCAVLNCGAGVPIKAPDRVGMGCNAGSEGTNSPATTVIGVVPLNVNCIKPAVSSLSCRGVCIHEVQTVSGTYREVGQACRGRILLLLIIVLTILVLPVIVIVIVLDA